MTSSILSSLARPVLYRPSPPQSFGRRLWNGTNLAVDGVTLLLLALALLSVVWSVEGAQWVQRMPLLSLVSFLAVGCGWLLARVRGPRFLLLAMGLVVGAVIVAWQMTTVSDGESWVDRFDDFYVRIYIWAQVAQAGGVSRDPLPFVFYLAILAWLIGLGGAWSVFRWNNPWVGVVPPGIAILVNLSYTPGHLVGYFVLYLLFSMLLMMWVNRNKQLAQWEQNQVVRRQGGSLGFIFNGLVMGGVLLGLAWLVPAGEPVPRLNELWNRVIDPWYRLERDFDRLFAALAPSQPAQLHTFERAFALRGGIDAPADSRRTSTAHLARTVVMIVAASSPQYWRGRSYAVYTQQGWESAPSEAHELGWEPQESVPEEYQLRQAFQHTVEVGYAMDLLFVTGQPLRTDLPVTMETAKGREFSLDLESPSRAPLLPSSLREAADTLRRLSATAGRLLAPEEVRRILPADVRVVRVQREGLRIKGLEMRRLEPNPPDVLVMRSTQRLSRSQKYSVTSSMSVATTEALRQAGDAYPGWVTDRYLQLPRTLPERVRQLARELTAQAETPYDKAMAVEHYLRQLPYSLKVSPPPPDRDVVDYFLFSSRIGYSDYHASAMVVLLRSVGIPARLATGYLGGDYDRNEKVFVVRERHAHAWPEVFFPNLGWVDFEPTPAFTEIPRAESPSFGTLGLSGEEELEEELPDPSGAIPAVAAEDTSGGLGALLRVLLSILWWLTGAVVAGLVLFLSGRLVWMRGLAGLGLAAQTYAKVGRLALLARLGGPRLTETPHEFTTRLARPLGDVGEELHQVAESYNETEYGRKVLSAGRRQGLLEAWLRIRRRFLRRLLRWQ